MNRFVLAVWSCCVSGLLAAASAQEDVWHQDGEITAPQSGWTFTPAKNPGGMTFNPSEGYYLDKGGKWLGPYLMLPDSQFRFYRFQFDSQASTRAYWAFSLFSAPEKRMVRDIYASIYPTGQRAGNVAVIYGSPDMNGVQPFFQSTTPIKVWNPKLSEITPLEAAAWCDRIYAELPPLEYQPPADRLKHLPRTMEALRTGKEWRIVVLGHSLYCDTFNSNFQALILRAFPRAKAKFLYTGRGATGCEYYQDHYREYVSPYKPDLLIVPGLDKENRISAIDLVVKQARQEFGCEILLMTEPFGADIRPHAENDRETPLPRQTIDANTYFKAKNPKLATGPMDFVSQQQRYAAEQKIAFLDAKTAWYVYIGNSGKPWEWFNRDVAHANDYGKQIVARMIERFFTMPE